MSHPTRIAAALTVLAVAGLTACAGKGAESVPAGTPPAASTSSTAPMVGGMTECTKDALAQFASRAAQAMGPDNVYAISDLHCADGWAVLTPTVGDGGDGYDTVVVVQAEGPVWALMDRGKVCGTSKADAQVPASLYDAACTTR